MSKPLSRTAAALAKLQAADVHPDSLRLSAGVFVLRRTYYYHNGQTADGWAQRVAAAGFKVLSSRDVRWDYRNSSFFEVRFVEA